MKKNSKPEKKKSAEKSRNDDELRTLNSSLGSFGLEPPKIYRQEQDSPSRSKAAQKKKKRSEPVRKTLSEKREEENRNRKKAKLRRKIISYTCLVLSVAAVIVVLSLTVLFKINTIKISGNTVYTEEEILAVLPITNETNLFLCDKDGASAKLTENLPYIYSVEIKRKLPSTLVVKITETPVVYSIKNNDKTYTLLDGNFKVLETAAKKNKKAIEIKNATLRLAVAGQSAEFSDDNQKNNLLKLTALIDTAGVDEITALYSDDVNNNCIIYDNRITVKLGTLDNLEKKLDNALAAIDRLSESNPNAEGVMTATDEKQVYFTEN